MTAIAAVALNGVVVMGADSAGVNSATKELQLRADAKVFRKGSMLLGVSGSWRTIQELKYKEVPEPIDGLGFTEWAVNILLPWLRLNINQQDLEKSEILIGYQGQIFHIYGGNQVAEEIAGFDACGSGTPYALASLYTSHGFDWSEYKRVYKALDSAERFCTDVRGPFYILKLEGSYDRRPVQE